jgi:hypothetical protein
MKGFRVIILAAIAGLALLLPWSEFGALGIQLVAPALLGILVAGMFADRSVLARSVLLLSLVLGVALARICWEAIVQDGGDWSFDGERSLVAMTVVFQLFFAAIAFIGTWLVLQKRHNGAEPGAAPNGGPATQLGNSNVTEGPPSVS